jgi:hypothetical protein
LKFWTGWDRKNFDTSWAEKITWNEFMNRVSLENIKEKV